MFEIRNLPPLKSPFSGKEAVARSVTQVERVPPTPGQPPSPQLQVQYSADGEPPFFVGSHTLQSIQNVQLPESRGHSVGSMIDAVIPFIKREVGRRQARKPEAPVNLPFPGVGFPP